MLSESSYFFFSSFNFNCFSDSPKLQPFSFPFDLNLKTPFVVVSCVLSSGNEPISFQWFKNGQPLSIDLNRIIIKNDKAFSVLELKKPNIDDIGNYTCLAKNAFG